MKKILFFCMILFTSCKTLAQECPKMKNFTYVKQSMESWVNYVEFGSGMKPTNVTIKAIGWEYKNDDSYLVGLYEDGVLKKVFPIFLSVNNFTHIKGVKISDSQITIYMRKHNYVNVIDCK